MIAEDLDYDGDVDQDDFGQFQACISGPGIPSENTETCRYADVDQDGDVDMSDFGILQRCYSVPGEPANLHCGGCALPKDDRQLKWWTWGR